MTRYMEPIPGHYDASDPFWSSPGAIRHHLGVDYNGVPRGTPFQAISSGTVTTIAWSDSVGWVTGVAYDDGMSGAYFHQDDRPNLSIGQHITIGQYIGVVGGSGSVASGPHLHINIGPTSAAIWGNEPLVDPYVYIINHLTDTAGDTGTPIQNIYPGDDNVIIYVSNSASADGVIPKGMGFIQEGGSGALRPMSSPEFKAYEYWADPKRGAAVVPFRKASWPGDDIRALTKSVGLLEFVNNTSADWYPYPKLTGRVIFADKASADFPRVSVQ